MFRFTVLTALIAALATGLPANAAEPKVELKKVHMCCEGCADEVAAILKKVEGVTGVTVDQKSTSARFTATDAKAAQKALDALAEGGFHGDTGGAKEIAFKDDSGVKAGKVKALMVTGFHNSCAGCVKSFQAAIKDVPGVTGVAIKPKVSSAVVTGNFESTDLVKALNKAGFHVKVK